MTLIKLTAALGALVIAATPALATTITNRDSKEHTLIVDRGTEQKNHKIPAGESLKVDCPDGCGFRLGTVGYGRQVGNDGKLLINDKGMLEVGS